MRDQVGVSTLGLGKGCGFPVLSVMKKRLSQPLGFWGGLYLWKDVVSVLKRKKLTVKFVWAFSNQPYKKIWKSCVFIVFICSFNWLASFLSSHFSCWPLPVASLHRFDCLAKCFLSITATGKRCGWPLDDGTAGLPIVSS